MHVKRHYPLMIILLSLRKRLPFKMVIKLVFKIAIIIVIIMCNTDCMKVGNHKEVIDKDNESFWTTHT